MAKPLAVVGLKEVGEILGVKASNVRKMMTRAGLEPTELAFGPVWDRKVIERYARERDADVKSRESDEKRRKSALAKTS